MGSAGKGPPPGGLPREPVRRARSAAASPASVFVRGPAGLRSRRRQVSSRPCRHSKSRAVSAGVTGRSAYGRRRRRARSGQRQRTTLPRHKASCPRPVAASPPRIQPYSTLVSAERLPRRFIVSILEKCGTLRQKANQGGRHVEDHRRSALRPPVGRGSPRRDEVMAQRAQHRAARADHAAHTQIPGGVSRHLRPRPRGRAVRPAIRLKARRQTP
jgi:hypothetical protein